MSIENVPGYLKAPEATDNRPVYTNVELGRIAAEIEEMGYLIFYDRLLVMMDAGENKKGSIIIPKGAEDKKWSGTVLAVGNGELAQTSRVRPTDRVIFNRWNPTMVELVLKDGSQIILNAYHAHDMYVGWRDEEAYRAYRDAKGLHF